MNNENYVVINGKKVELTDEQLEQLGIEVKPKRNNPFDRVNNKEKYYLIGEDDLVVTCPEDFYRYDQKRFNISNYFNDESFANQVMLHQQLYRKLLKYAYDNNVEVPKEDWEDGSIEKYKIQYSHFAKRFMVNNIWYSTDVCNVFFKDETVAKQAIKDIIEPFMKEHPEFVW